MFLKDVSSSNFGPFWGGQAIIEPDVTVITGANDVGKSSFLRLLKIICSRSGDNGLTEADVNCDRENGLVSPWDQDKGLTASATFYDPNQPNLQAVVTYSLAPKVWNTSSIKGPNYSGPLHGKVDILPTAVFLDLGVGPQIREAIPLDSPSVEERNLLNIAFDREFRPEVLAGRTESAYERTVGTAEERLNEGLKRILPPTMDFRFRLRTKSDQRKVLYLSLLDGYGGITELNRRGRGIRVYLSMLGHLHVQNYSSGEVLLLLDEPETHLHADAQHAFRDSLEKLASTNRFQVVYATHSPSMVNTLRPHSVRLITRTIKDERAVSVIENTPFTSGGFSSVRSSLGVTPSDSLLFAPITIVVEGTTEIICLPILFKRLSDEPNSEFGDLAALLAQTILIHGEGCSNIGNLCRVARANGASVIAFADDDQSKRWEKQLEKESENTPLIRSKSPGEFEEVVPIDRYFEALNQYYRDMNQESSDLSVTDYNSWSESQKDIKARGFTKRLFSWLSSVPDRIEPKKPLVMKKAVENTPLSEIDLGGIRNLIAAMKHALNQLKIRD